ncbi:HepT-like ribonuclease domain-containing protein [Deinococcus aquiradiocola]|uniref:Polymerase nucleotidyl transferase domain-containing protein n=1 Tax=Deinococcus aquiradiocola TaxID=393059 RepID=A0A917PFQ5_9DEIO|nr:HepT-like ribonuclease domain-containing protein [Deinococcus aquiradiocola]GGJ75269.1 hypothetical protein GCM10008939_19430 [Deinococcus aquiradiocola]
MPDAPAPHASAPQTEAPRLLGQPRLAEVSAYLRQNEPRWRALGITRVELFGSVARDDAANTSDVDLLVTFAHPAGLLDQVRAVHLFEALLGRRTDVLTHGALKPGLKAAVQRDARDISAPTPQDTTTQDAPSDPARKRSRWRVQDLLTLLDRLQTLTAPHTLQTYLHAQDTQDAAAMNLLRLGEGTKFIPQDLQDAHPDVPWDELRSVRNLIAHDYFGLDPHLVWHTLTRDLPALRPHLQALHDTLPEDA